jgi:hypothetical protein
MAREAMREPVRGPARRTFTETKLGTKTSEFALTVIFVIAVLLATYLDEDSLARADGWRFAGFAVAAYAISRGLAKLGTREPYTDEGDRRS